MEENALPVIHTLLPRRVHGLVLAAMCLLAAPLLAQPAGPSAGASVPVQVAVVEERLIREVVGITGTVTSPRDASLSPSISGLVTALLVDAGSRVQAGDLLLELDPELAELEWRSATAAVEAASIALDDARRRLEEAQRLAPQQSIAESVVLDIAAEVEQDRALLQQARADAAYRKALLERHRLRAPFGGIVRSRQTDVGEWVVPGSPVLELVSTEELRIDFPVAEDYLDAIGPEARVAYRLGNSQSDASAGRVAAVVPVSDPGARTFLLRVEPTEPLASMVPGMSATGELSLDTGRNALVVPRDAIVKYADGRVVAWVLESSSDGDVVRERPVSTGHAFDGMVEVRTGLQPDARVVVKGNEALTSGQRVEVRG